MDVNIQSLDEAKVLEAIKGYKIIDYRIPNKGELYLYSEYKICKGVGANIVAYPILERVRWRAEKGGRYYYINSFGGLLIVGENKEARDYIDDNYYNDHNYFEAKALALDALKKVKDVLCGEG